MDDRQILISFPNWVYAVMTGGVVSVIFYLGALHYQIRKLLCLGDMHSQLSKICKEFPRIQESLIRISEILSQKKMTKSPIYTASSSPIRLTEEGKKAIEDSGFMKFYEVNKQTLIDRITQNKPKTMADLEEACKSVMLPIESSLPSFELLKQFSYENGQPIAEILFAGAIALRDILQKELNIRD